MQTKLGPYAGLVEFAAAFAPCPQPGIVVFDFDGTVSWLRHGWPDLMCQVFLPFYPFRPEESVEDVRRELLVEILSGNGRPSIFQMRKFVERVQALGAKVPAPEELLRQYQGRLDEIIVRRSDLILRGQARTDDFLVLGARTMLELLERRGAKLFVLSGTLEKRVQEEARLLDVARYFGGRIMGSPPNPIGFSKRAALDKILAEENLGGGHLVCFGDGPVEILHARELGGLAVGVASDENEHDSGRMDSVKRDQLIQAGAHLVIPDYRDAAVLVEALFHE